MADIDYIKRLLSEKSHRISLCRPRKCKSDVWKKFAVVQLDGEQAGFVVCEFCAKVLRYDTRKTGTSNLKHHRCFNAGCSIPNADSATINTDSNGNGDVSNAEETMHSTENRDSMIVAVCEEQDTGGADSDIHQHEDSDNSVITSAELVELYFSLYTDCLVPAEVLEGPKFRQFAQKLIHFGAQWGLTTSVDSVFPPPCSLGTYVDMRYIDIKQNIIRKFQAVGAVGLTCDVWTWMDGTKYVSVCGNYVQRFQLVNLYMGTKECPKDGNGDKEFKFLVDSIVNEYVNVTAKRFYVMSTDLPEATCFPPDQKITCASLTINSVGNYFLESLPSENPISQLIEDLRSFVHLLNQDHVQDHLTIPVPACDFHRWDEIHALLKTICVHYEDLMRLLPVDKFQHIGMSLPKWKCTKLLNLLEPLKLSLEELCVLEQPTLHLVVPIHRKLRKTYSTNVNESDDKFETMAKELLLRSLETKFRIEPLHYVAVVLDPRLKSLTQVLPSAEERDKVYKDVRRLLEEVDIKEVPCAKRTKVDPNSSFLSDFYETIAEPESSDEFDKYLKHPNASANQDIFEFWAQNEPFFPTLSHLASLVLAVPATSTVSCLNKSADGDVFDDRRKQLVKDKYFEPLMFIKYNQSCGSQNSITH